MDTDKLLLPCPHCGATNRVPAARLGEAPNCGKCGQPLLDGHPLELNDANFDAVVAASPVPVLVDFWAPWCGPCRAMAPAFEQAGKQLKGRALLVKVNSDDNPGLSQRFGIRSIPTLVRLQQGQETQRQSGALPAGGDRSARRGLSPRAGRALPRQRHVPVDAVGVGRRIAVEHLRGSAPISSFLTGSSIFLPDSVRGIALTW